MRGEGRPHRDLSRIVGARRRSGASRHGQRKLYILLTWPSAINVNLLSKTQEELSYFTSDKLKPSLYFMIKNYFHQYNLYQNFLRNMYSNRNHINVFI